MKLFVASRCIYSFLVQASKLQKHTTQLKIPFSILSKHDLGAQLHGRSLASFLKPQPYHHDSAQAHC